MKNYTIEEKKTLLEAISSRIQIFEDAYGRGNFDDWRELKIKLILDIAPIEVKEARDLFKHPCILCGELDRGGSPEWAFVDDKKICPVCFEKYAPELYKKTAESNKQYWIKEYPNKVNPDGTFKNVVPAGVQDDSLPF